MEISIFLTTNYFHSQVSWEKKKVNKNQEDAKSAFSKVPETV